MKRQTRQNFTFVKFEQNIEPSNDVLNQFVKCEQKVKENKIKENQSCNSSAASIAMFSK